MPKPYISMITDFGISSHHVGAMKGVIRSICPEAEITDITHDIEPFNILQAAYILDSVAGYFPSPTIHMIVVDPGVGSARKPIIGVGENHYYVAPDNGVITRVVKSDNINRVHAVEEEHYLIPSECQTFHGRDVFAPVAAWLAKHHDASKFGEPMPNYTTLDIPKPTIVKERTIKCSVLFIDRFGNVITNMERVMFNHARTKFPGKTLKTKVGNTVINDLKNHYFDVPNPGDALVYFGSMDLLEIGLREDNAAQKLNINIDDPVYFLFAE